jgi:plastocyanin
MRVVLYLMALAIVVMARGGVITGTVKAKGHADAEQGAGGKYDSRKYKFVEKLNYSELRDFVVSIEGPVSGVTNRTPVTRSVLTTKLTQRDAAFKPHILPVAIGTKVEWPNEDDIFHNVFSMSEPKLFDLGLYKGSPPEKAVTFDKAGRIDVFCSIHSQMHCVVLVLENPFFATTDARGRYTLSDVPPGTYKLKAWHERLPPQSLEITVPEQGEVKLDFTLGIKNLPKY